MRRSMGAGLVLAVGLGWWGSPAWGQVLERERDVTVTGPRGRTLERDFRSVRGPGFIDRQVEIHRPGGTFERDVRIGRMPHGPHIAAPGPAWRGGGFVPTGGFLPGPRSFIERNVIIEKRPSIWPALAVGGGLFGLGMFAGSALATPPPPPPVPVPVPVYAAPPVYMAAPAAQPPVVVYNPPQPYTPQPAAPPTVTVDPVADAVGRLQSHHDNSRREGAYALGRLRDARAVPALVDRLKNDDEKEVRIAAATALGEIGDPRAIPFLERATIYDPKQAVRDAAGAALVRIPPPNPAPAAPLEVPPNPAPAIPLDAPTTPTSVTVPNLSAPEPIGNTPPPSPEPASRAATWRSRN